jgi:hypothetical protein
MSIETFVLLDRDRDGSFEDLITDDVLAMDWRLGMSRPYDVVAAPSRATLTLDNRQGLYTALLPGDGVTIRRQAPGGALLTGFVGVVESVEVAGRGRVRVQAHGLDAWLHTLRGTVAPGIQVTADTMIERLLAEWPPLIAYNGYLIIDLDGHNMINSGVLVWTPDPRLMTQPGRSTFAYVGDTWRESEPLIDAIREVVTSERGRFYAARDGTLVFVNRHYTLLNSATVATFEDTMLDWDFAYGADLINRVEVACVPRRIGPANSAVWRTTNALRVEPGVTRRIIVRYRDDNDRAIGVLDLVEPVDYTARTSDGTDISAFVEVAAERIGVNAAALTLTNLTAVPAFVDALTLHGTPLITEDALVVVAEDGESRTRYGPRSVRLWLPALTDVEEAQAVAEYELARRKDPAGRARSITVRIEDDPTLRVQLLDRIRVKEAHTGHDGDYLICAEAHEVTPDGHYVTWLLEPAETARYLVVDVNAIDDAERVIAPF